MEKELNISDYLDKEYKNYAFYVLESRALPSIVDGFKSSSRKIINSATKRVKNDFDKVNSLAGTIVGDSNYHHGPVSAETTIVNLSQKFKNNFPLFEEKGIFGTLRTPEASSSRYLKVKLTEKFNKIFLDDELLEYKIEEGKKIEPKYYLPIIPLLLVNGASGISLGHACNILQRDFMDVINASIAYLENKKTLPSIKLKVLGFTGKFIQDTDNPKKWYNEGIYEINNTSTLTIKEIPLSQTFEKYENFLDELVDKKEINGYENLGEECINYQIKISRDKLAALDELAIIKLFRLRESEVENFTCLDENGKLIIFNNHEEILKYFIDFRLGFYTKRKDLLLSSNISLNEKLNNQIQFIRLVVNNKIIVNNKKKEDIIKQLESHSLLRIEGDYNYLLNMSIYSLTQEKIMELEKNIKENEIKIDEIRKSDPKKTYIKELKELIK